MNWLFFQTKQYVLSLISVKVYLISYAWFETQAVLVILWLFICDFERLRICLFSFTYPLIYSHPWSFTCDFVICKPIFGIPSLAYNEGQLYCHVDLIAFQAYWSLCRANCFKNLFAFNIGFLRKCSVTHYTLIRYLSRE